GAHRDAVGDRDRVELQRRTPRRANPRLHVRGQLAEMEVAGADLDPCIRDADERLLQVGVGEAHRVEHGPRRGAARAGGQRIRTERHETTSNGSGNRLSRVLQLAYEPSVRTGGANSARDGKS